MSLPPSLARFLIRSVPAILIAGLLAACAPQPEDAAARRAGGEQGKKQSLAGYGQIEDAGYTLPAVDPQYTAGVNRRATVTYTGRRRRPAPSSSIRSPSSCSSSKATAPRPAIRSPSGREGKGFPATPPSAARRSGRAGSRPPTCCGPSRRFTPSTATASKAGCARPLGARALYLYRGGRDTYFRIHGTNDMASIGHNSSAGCIRLFNHDIIDLFERATTSTNVRVRTLGESVVLEGEAMAHRGDDMAPTMTSIDGSTPALGDGRLPVLEPDLAG